jgi:septal ring factor EnvC (AmiA/AmiB activator)
VDGKDDEDDGEIMENGVKRPMTKAEKQNAKKKRRKEREREAKMEEAAAKREEQEKEEMAKPVGESVAMSGAGHHGGVGGPWAYG